MDNSVANAISEVKYKKLASEYAKLRAQASVLKKAVLEEQAKYGTLREQLRHREATMRRTEQEVDSLGFRNKQLEQRVAALQLELCKSDDAGKRSKSYRRLGLASGNAAATSSGSSKPDYSSSSRHSLSGSAQDLAQDALIFEELQKKIMENAQLTSLVDDKSRDVILYTERIAHLEQNLEKRCAEQSDMEKRLRRELEALQSKNAELETKLVEAVSMLGSEDALSVTGSDFTPLQQSTNFTSACLNTTVTDTRISSLEKEVLHWRTQYELAKMQEASNKQIAAAEAAASTSNTAGQSIAMQNDMSCGCSTTAAGITVTPSQPESKSAQRARDSLQEPPNPPSKETIIYNNVSQKYEELLKSKCLAESRVASYETETENLQGCLENATDELKAKDEQIWSLNQAIQMLEEDLTTTRVNYEEQISVLTEQVINLSDQLAACK